MITEETTIRETTIKVTTIKSPKSTMNTTGSITTSIGAPNYTIENEFTETTTIPAVIQTLPPVQEILNISNLNMPNHSEVVEKDSILHYQIDNKS